MFKRTIFPPKFFLVSGILLVVWSFKSGFFMSDYAVGTGDKYQVGLHFDLWSLMSLFFGIICLAFYYLYKAEHEEE